ncbi:hypothetical protein [Flavobacterium silvaticum]|uniref:Uncharacterized protein n=1 Tax=Flavobacterium silvaticum TaxID=1852020 RepID=A0A972FUI7_9FLAO|nr:hypothetical protein [Flavobacterium silvaticum]NMH28282.1 hypothetical protein [Flavobacterium silvaticum]
MSVLTMKYITKDSVLWIPFLKCLKSSTPNAFIVNRYLLFLFLIYNIWNAHSQSLLTTTDVNFETDVNDIWSATDEPSKQFWVFMASKSTTTAFTFNKELFQRDSVSFARPDSKFENIAGCSFDDSGNPTIYWSSADSKRIFTQTLNQKNHSLVSKSYLFDFENEDLLVSFNDHGRFCLLTSVKDSSKLVLYDFKNGVPEMHVLDFTAFPFQNPRGQNFLLSRFLDRYPMQYIDQSALSSLYMATEKCKLYAFDDKLLLTFDDNPTQTRIFEIQLSDFSITESKVPQQSFTDEASSNSFINQNTLLQFKANKNEMLLSAFDLKSKQPIKTYRVTSEDTISFKNSPLLVQSPDDKLSTLSSTKKFLRRINQRPIGVSIYRHKDGRLIVTAGATYDYISTGDVILGTTLGIGMVVAGAGSDIDRFIQEPLLQTVFFEGIFDKNFEHVSAEQPSLYIDVLNRYLTKEQPELYAISHLRNFFVLSYYDKATKKLVMRKFSDSKILD